ncbi:hypothetical protein [Christensenella hongkongensis]|uniref:Ribbon-helix-helix protein CopG domain-containing protein n=1 Tax=Christensenella hongkongensis TaxID=270498 RepID=A0A0M2NLD9_9FIRM|nr:hypothetical protein [Christensenella hongkongensis]KKI51252.1 hypothetical protein CHK_1259 [Christensenella hongkongensis]KKI51789.1 hypothetical protein CHK_0674 [Christensenella hongkongensis]TCW24791.1 hypothetical protein EV208_1213 [Christensenella hongkongensis]TCW30383.1 hypothetical protein EV208_1023 [Christensenella hongkongensis]
MDKIILEIHRPVPITVDRVRIDEEALKVLQELQRETGLPARRIVSELIKQGSRLIEVKEI